MAGPLAKLATQPGAGWARSVARPAWTTWLSFGRIVRPKCRDVSGGPASGRLRVGEEPVHARSEAPPVLGDEPVGGAPVEDELGALDAGGGPPRVAGRDHLVLAPAAHQRRGVDALRIRPVGEPLGRRPELGR